MTPDAIAAQLDVPYHPCCQYWGDCHCPEFAVQKIERVKVAPKPQPLIY